MIRFSPKRVSLDALGTLFAFRQPVHVQYHKIAKQHGLNLSIDQLEISFKQAYAALSRSNKALKGSKNWWENVVVETFTSAHSAPNHQYDRIFEQIWLHFSTSRGYILYPEVPKVLSRLSTQTSLVITTNMDKRIESIIDDFGLLGYFDQIICSESLAMEKPNSAMFQAMASETISIKEILHVGDDYKCDYLGAINAGASALFLQRDPALSAPLGTNIIRNLGELYI